MEKHDHDNGKNIGDGVFRDQTSKINGAVPTIQKRRRFSRVASALLQGIIIGAVMGLFTPGTGFEPIFVGTVAGLGMVILILRYA